MAVPIKKLYYDKIAKIKYNLEIALQEYHNPMYSEVYDEDEIFYFKVLLKGLTEDEIKKIEKQIQELE